MTHLLPTHPTMRDPRTGDPLRALGIGKRGPIWPVMGGDGTTPPPPPTPQPPAPAPTPTPGPAPAPPGTGQSSNPAPANPPGDDPPLGPAGERALAAERAARKELEQRLAKLSPLENLATALAGNQPAGSGKSEVELLQERFAQHEKTVAEERAARYRAEVAHANNLTPEQAAWLQGSTREELEANAAKLLAAFPSQPAGPRTPAPDPSQGARGGNVPADLESQIAAAQKAGDVNRVIALQKSKLANVPR